MKSLKTFKIGGVHPEENKRSANAPIQNLPFPKQAIVPLGQNLGAPSKPLVKRGDEVKTGQLIGSGESFISARLHSPFTGKVSKVDNFLDSSGYRRPAIVIEVQEEDVWDDGIDTTDTIKREITADRQTIIDTIKSCGIVGLGGATFPTHVKMMIPDGKKAEYLIINGVECEPYLTSDHRLMLEKGEELLIGIQILMKALDVEKAIVGIENNKRDAINHLTELAAGFESIHIQPLKVKYPQGGEKQLINATVNREVPSGKLPIEVGCVVSNVGTAFAVYEAVQKNKPLIERIVTVTGKAVKKPSNFKVRIGTPVQQLIDAAEGLPENTGKIINGGPMMGKAIISTEVPVVKGTSGILLMKREESRRKTALNCIRCSKCSSVCPMGLEPYLLLKLVKLERYEDGMKERIMDCIECGSCQFTCPSNLPLLDYLKLGKQRAGQIIRSRK
ncbi:MAG: electron transport complex subunit RsxC [Bacteroidales bacterium]|nr:electron transport complex subunit RsxC [Bacteroidales bacterium]